VDRSVQNTRTQNHDTTFLNNPQLIKITSKILRRKPGRDLLENLDVDEWLILKLILKHLGMKLSTGRN
jgi:hypothetical protein